MKGCLMLKLKDIIFEAPPTTIIDRLSRTFENGKLYAITGPNGSGKTTVAKIIMGINAQTS